MTVVWGSPEPSRKRLAENCEDRAGKSFPWEVEKNRAKVTEPTARSVAPPVTRAKSGEVIVNASCAH